ncbi:MAG: hypothetical protein ABFQ89_04270 [Chloroflexota bacterium]
MKEKSGFSKLIEKIPGIGDFIARNNYRAADKLLRETLVRRLSELGNRMDGLQQQMISGPGLLLLDDMERVRTKLTILSDTVATASYGYAGLFDKVKVDEEILARVYDFDSSLYEHIHDIDGALDKLEFAIDYQHDLAPVVKKIGREVSEALQAYRQRDDVFTEEE